MEFLKKNKKILIIGLVLIVVIALGVWWYKSRNTSAVTDASASSDSAALAKKIASKIAEIKANEEWFTQIKNGASASGYTEAQAVAVNAIWALKHDGAIPLDTFGAGEWGHVDYVKANY